MSTAHRTEPSHGLKLLDAWRTITSPSTRTASSAWEVVRRQAVKVARSVTRDSSAADEVASELLMAFFRLSLAERLPALETEALVAGYLKRAALNVHLKQTRSHRLEVTGLVLKGAGDVPQTIEPREEDRPPTFFDQALQEADTTQRADLARQHLEHARRVVRELAMAAIDDRPARYREEALRVWEELRQVHLEGRPLDEVIVEVDGALAATQLVAARTRRYQNFKRLRQKMLEIAKSRLEGKTSTALEFRLAEAFILSSLKGAHVSDAKSPRVSQRKKGIE